MNEVFQIVEIIPIVSAFAASTERSFSAIRRMKTYFGANMSQKR